MSLLSLSTYLPAGDLARIMATALVVSISAPSAVAVAIAGIDRRDSGAVAVGTALFTLGASVLLLLVDVGLYALVQR
jgi:hypothetical protein